MLESHDARARASAAVGVILGLLALLAAVTRSRVLARAAVLYAPAAIALGLAWRSSLAIGFGALALALVAGVSRRAFVPLLVVVFAGALLVLWHWPVTNALATIGPHPDGGHRFYGVTNQVETMLLAPALAGGLVVAPLALVAVGWSRAGADGGGLVTYAAGYAMLALRAVRPDHAAPRRGRRRRRPRGRPRARRARRGDRRLEPRHACDRRRLAGRPRPSLARVLRRRDAQRRRVHHVRLGSGAARSRRTRSPAARRSSMRCSSRSSSRSSSTTRRRTSRSGGARRDLAPRVGAISCPLDSRRGCAVSFFLPRSRSRSPAAAAARRSPRRRRRSSARSSEGPTGSAAGKAVFDANGCGGCHTLQAGGIDRQGRAGSRQPRGRRRQKANQGRSTTYTKESIEDPNAYVVPGYPKA